MRYLVESYHSSTADAMAAEESARAAAAATAGSGSLVRYVESIFVPGDEVCFHLFEAPSSAALRQALDKAAVDFERVLGASGDDHGDYRQP